MMHFAPYAGEPMHRANAEPEMQDEDKLKEQFMIELHELRERVAESKKDEEGGTPCRRQS